VAIVQKKKGAQRLKASSQVVGIGAADKVTRAEFAKHFVEAAIAGDDDPKASEYRRLGGTKRDLSPIQYQHAQQLSFYLWQRNPLFARMIEIVVNFCTGDEVKVNLRIKKRIENAPDVDQKREDAQKIWDDFADDPVNRVHADLPVFTQDLLINGELLIPATVNRQKDADGNYKGDSLVRIGYFDPGNVVEVKADPNNIRIIQSVEMRAPNAPGQNIPFTVINVDTDSKNVETYGKMVGQVFYWQINKVANQTRGHGMLITLMDWVDSFDQFLFDALEGVRLRNAFFYTATMKGKTQEQLEELAKKVKAPASGTVRLANENTTWDVVTPDLKAMDVDQVLRTFQVFIVGTKGFPSTWFGSGEDANRASSTAMSIPTMRMLKATQKIVKRIIKDMARFVIDQAVIGKTLKLAKDEYVDCEVSMFDFERQDASVISNAFVQMVTALVAAKEAGWVSDETAKKMIDGTIEKYGVTVEEGETVEQIRDEQDLEVGLSVYGQK
jgi:hypothetical protein